MKARREKIKANPDEVITSQRRLRHDNSLKKSLNNGKVVGLADSGTKSPTVDGENERRRAPGPTLDVVPEDIGLTLNKIEEDAAVVFQNRVLQTERPAADGVASVTNGERTNGQTGEDDHEKEFEENHAGAPAASQKPPSTTDVFVTQQPVSLSASKIDGALSVADAPDPPQPDLSLVPQDDPYPAGSRQASPLRGAHTAASENVRETMRLIRGVKLPAHLADYVLRSPDPHRQRTLAACLRSVEAAARTPYFRQTPAENAVFLDPVVVDEEVAPLLRVVFEHYCALGERTNTEWLSCAKWIRLLSDACLVDHHKLDVSKATTDRRMDPRRGKGSARSSVDSFHSASAGSVASFLVEEDRRSLPRAEAELLHRSTLATCDPGMTKLSFDLFCRAIALLALRLRPSLALEGAAGEQGVVSSSTTASSTTMVFAQQLYRDLATRLLPLVDLARIGEGGARLTKQEAAALAEHEKFFFELFNAYASRLGGSGGSAGGLGRHKRQERSFAVAAAEDRAVARNLEDSRAVFDEKKSHPQSRTYAVSLFYELLVYSPQEVVCNKVMIVWSLGGGLATKRGYVTAMQCLGGGVNNSNDRAGGGGNS